MGLEFGSLVMSPAGGARRAGGRSKGKKQSMASPIARSQIEQGRILLLLLLYQEDRTRHDRTKKLSIILAENTRVQEK